jgi:4-amino-4-deoxy-L-arabinose transferase-like glycosyltransferase
MTSGTISYPARQRSISRPRIGALLRQRPELVGLLGVAAVLNLWGLSINGWANTYYSAAVRSMSSSWHDFLFASLDKSGLMTVDKPPLALWVQALSARLFGFHPLSLLVPQALMGVVAVGLMYDLTRRRFGRPAGFVAGLALATTPVIVAVSRHNNPDELLVLCSVAAIWFALRALETGRTKWLVFSGIAVGLGFETKMGVALMVVPGIAAAWLWIAPAARGRLHALWQLLVGGSAMVAVALAWPVLVWLTPAADRPWISGTSDNSIWSLILGYNGFGRLSGQTGGPGGGGGGAMFGGATGPFRLLQSSLGDQAGWLLGFAVVAGLAILVVSRLRRDDARTGWLLVVGGAFASTAVAFSFASGIFHPYYVSMLAPFAAALVGAGVGMMLDGPSARVIAPLAIVAGAITEWVVLGKLGGQLAWAKPLVIVLGVGAAVALAMRLSPRVRMVLVAVAVAALLAAPATWAAETLGHATSGTFPTGGPANAVSLGSGGPGGRGGPGGGFGSGRFGRPPGLQGGAGFAPPSGGTVPGASSGQFTPGGSTATNQATPGGSTSTGQFTPGGASTGQAGPGAFGAAGGGPAGFGGDNATLTAAIKYAKAHGGGTIGVSSQSSAAEAILSSNGDVAGLGGFSGRESSVTAKWIASEVAAGRLRWIIVDSNQGMRLPGDTRTGSQTAMDAVAKSCKAVTLKTANGTATMYDCSGRAAAILAAAGSSGN